MSREMMMRSLLILAGAVLLSLSLPAQRKYDCKSQTFAELPAPGTDIETGDFCKGTMVPARSKAVLQIADSRIGKAKGCRVDLQVDGKRLEEVKVVSPDKKTSKKLYQSLVELYGNPGRLDEVNGLLIYTWASTAGGGAPMERTYHWKGDGTAIFTMTSSGMR